MIDQPVTGLCVCWRYILSTGHQLIRSERINSKAVENTGINFNFEIGQFAHLVETKPPIPVILARTHPKSCLLQSYCFSLILTRGFTEDECFFTSDTCTL
jgi:hypothetical protein